MKSNINGLDNFKKYRVLSVEKQVEIIGGGHCYNKSCLRSRDKSMYSAGSFIAGFGYGVCQGVGVCD